MAALNDVGYEQPSPIQAATIPHILSGVDVVGQAQTGTGKTAAFALPILSKIDIDSREPQALVLVPTRELAIQVAEAFQRYATHLKGFHVMPIYGGQSYTPQLQSLRRGVHVVVGTPGRVMDHLKRGTLKLNAVRYFVLDEADEMLRMGFIDDVEWILGQAPESRQIALFSATMPAEVRRIAQNHLRKPAEVTIRSKTSTASSIRQRFWMVSGMHKLDALTRILEAETFDAMIVFARTKQATTELAERLEARGFAVEPLNGDIPQNLRERTIARLKAGQIDIVVATDVAARGLDVDRVSHVVNFDVPYDPESYVHRIGRTGRAGRSGDAILFIAPRERNMLRVIERATRQAITQMELPTVEDVNEQRVNRFNQRITDALAAGEADAYRSLIERYEQTHNVPAVEIAAALASMAQGKTPLLLDSPRGRSKDESAPAQREGKLRDTKTRDAKPRESKSVERELDGAEPKAREARPRSESRQKEDQSSKREWSPEAPRREFEPHERKDRKRRDDDEALQTYRVEVGEVHGVKPANIVGAIANEAGLEGRFIGRVVIRDDHSFVDLPGGMPKEIFRSLQKVRVAGQQLQISLALRTQAQRLERERPTGKHKKKGKPPRR
ncbi:DEAD/DEAH box helicase [Povalibacter uvarum]